MSSCCASAGIFTPKVLAGLGLGRDFSQGVGLTELPPFVAQETTSCRAECGLQKSYCQEDIEDYKERNRKKSHNQTLTVDFPLIEQIQQEYSDRSFLLAPILTDQTAWVEQREKRGEKWKTVAALDGIWWKEILEDWCQTRDLPCHSISLSVNPDIEDDISGAANWESMARAMTLLLENYIKISEDKTIEFIPGQTPISKIVIQHSSGTPALSSALYLWGVERKLEGINVEFVYIAKEENERLSRHQGTHWQWRLKVPQIRELLKIQDFSGALQLLKSHLNQLPPTERERQEYRNLQNELEFLDKSVSLNLEPHNISEGRESILERISIALWSEKAFRERGQWMHWYLRVAGAFELAIYLLVEERGKPHYRWTQNQNRDDLQCVEKGKSEWLFKQGIAKIVKGLLSADVRDSRNNLKNNFSMPNPILDTETTINGKAWKDFVKFYTIDWEIIAGQKVGAFTHIRNNLYHNLTGDIIDRLLDQRTEELGSVDRAEHPSQVAVDWLIFLLKLAKINSQIETKVEAYREKVETVRIMNNE